MQDSTPAAKTLEEAVEQMVLDRINVYGAQQNEAVQQAYTRFDTAIARLKVTFTHT